MADKNKDKKKDKEQDVFEQELEKIQKEQAAQEEKEAQEATAQEEATEAAADEAQDAEAAEDADASEEKKGFFKKKDAKKDNKLEEKVNELTDQVKRQMAEFDNFRKRSEKEKSAMFETGAKSVIEKILPVVDNFERGLATVPEDEKGKPFSEGMEMIYKQLISELEKLEVKPIEAVGKEFNPDLHNAVMQVESEEYESGVIAQELQKGYTYRDSVVRHAMVAVVQ